MTRSVAAIVVSELLLEDVVDINRVRRLAAQFNRRLMEEIGGRDAARLGSCLGAGRAPEHSAVVAVAIAVASLDCVAEATLIGASRAVNLASIDGELGGRGLLPVALLVLLLANGLALAGGVVLGGRRVTACRVLSASQQRSLLPIGHCSATLQHELI